MRARNANRAAGALIANCCTALLLASAAAQGGTGEVGRYNVVWTSPSQDATGVMPLGNGDIAAGVYALEGGKLVAWDIAPAARRADVTVGAPQPGKPPAPTVPANAHPLRAGSDQSEANRFRGQLGRVTMFRGRLSAPAIRELAAGDRTQPVAMPDVVGCWLNPKAGDKLVTPPGPLDGTVSFEAWICPAEKEAGRILDKLTPGQRDGFLLDTWPDLSLRAIAGDRERTVSGVLKPGVWQHVALVLDRAGPRLYLNGQPAN